MSFSRTGAGTSNESKSSGLSLEIRGRVSNEEQWVPRSLARDGQLEAIVGGAGSRLGLQLPGGALVQLLNRLMKKQGIHEINPAAHSYSTYIVAVVRHGAQNAVDDFCAVELLLALARLLRRDTALREVNVALWVKGKWSARRKFGFVAGNNPTPHLLLVDTQHDDGLVLAHADQLVDGADAPPRQLAEQDQALEDGKGLGRRGGKREMRSHLSVVVLQQGHGGAHIWISEESGEDVRNGFALGTTGAILTLAIGSKT